MKVVTQSESYIRVCKLKERYSLSDIIQKHSFVRFHPQFVDCESEKLRIRFPTAGSTSPN